MTKWVFSSDDLPRPLGGRKRASAWVDSMRAIGASFDFDIAPAEGFGARTEIMQIGALAIGTAQTKNANLVRVYRPNALIARDDDDRVQLMANVGDDPMHGRQFGREVVLGRGDITVFAMGSPSEVFTPASGHSVAVIMPKALLADGATVEDLAATPVGQGSEAARLLVGHVLNLLETNAPLEPKISALASDYLAGLAGILVGGKHDARRDAKHRSLPAARLAAIHALLQRRFRDPRLDATSVGASLGLSARYVQHLLQQAGLTFTGELMRLRVEAAHDELIAEPLGGRPIADIAFHCGFVDLSTFYRAFRRRFSDTPNALRAAARSRP